MVWRCCTSKRASPMRCHSTRVGRRLSLQLHPAKGHALSDALHAHNWIVRALVKRGHSVWAEFRLG